MPSTAIFWAEPADVRCIFYNASGQKWNGTDYEDHDDANWSTYLQAATKIGTTKEWQITTPADATAFAIYEGAAPALTATPLGSATFPDTNLASLVQQNAAQGVWFGVTIDGIPAGQVLGYNAAALSGLTSGNNSNPATGQTEQIRDVSDSRVLMEITTDSVNNRTTVTRPGVPAVVNNA